METRKPQDIDDMIYMSTLSFKDHQSSNVKDTKTK